MKNLKKLFLPVLAAAFLAAPAQAADTLMMATTTSSSASVKPEVLCLFLIETS